MKATPYTGTVASWRESAQNSFVEWESGQGAIWRDDLGSLCYRVTTPHDQATLHRSLARAGYVPELVAQDDEADYWYFYHPDGPH